MSGLSRAITIHKVESINELDKPICGAFVSKFNPDVEKFVSIHDKSVTCSRCLQLIEERKHIKDGRLVF